MNNELQSIVQQVLAQVPTLLTGIPKKGVDYVGSFIKGDLSSVFGQGWSFKIHCKPSLAYEGLHKLSVNVIEPEGRYMCTRLLQSGTYKDMEKFLLSPECEQNIVEVIPEEVDTLKDSLFNDRKYLHR